MNQKLVISVANQCLCEMLGLILEMIPAKILHLRNYFNSGDDKRWKKNIKLGPFQLPKVEETSAGKNLDYSKNEKEKRGWRKIGRNVVESNCYEIAVVALTFVALFMEDIETVMLTGALRHTDAYGWLDLGLTIPFSSICVSL